MPPPRRRRRAVRSASAVAALSIVCSMGLVACRDHDQAGDRPGDRPARPGDQPADVRGVAEQVVLSPLTGRPVGLKPPTHPVLAVKIDNSSSSAPQVGLGSAGLVVEELVEGGITRLAAFYYADVPEVVGPVRSMRATDIGVVRPLDAVLVASGGAAPTVSRVKQAGIHTFTEQAPGYYREAGRVAPYNLFMRLQELAEGLADSDPPEPYLPFGAPPSLPRGEPASGLTATFSPSSSSTFAYRDRRYVNTDTLAAGGDQFNPDTVLVLRVDVADAGYLDPAGNPVPETVFEGRGDAMVFSGGRVVRGTWSKAGLEGDLQLRAGGNRVTLPRGKVYIALVPTRGGSVTVTG